MFGVSLDRLDQHRAFAASLNLNFPLISDPKRKVASAFGVLRLWGLLPFTKRVTFVIDRSGTIRNVIAAEFDIDAHVEGAIATLGSM
jgi:peroxiredoxin Q/BCP